MFEGKNEFRQDSALEKELKNVNCVHGVVNEWGVKVIEVSASPCIYIYNIVGLNIFFVQVMATYVVLTC